MVVRQAIPPVGDPQRWAFSENLMGKPVILIEPAHKLKIDQNKLQNCRSNILNLVNVL
ncbi:hypothetical protein D1AOALGA4SA_2737 [Olavius algarvensis Delta 1 endosymbiont]|nr:hypothetical protein D1AOALGA4SA_2737 [Olavius algarvensis Delta 1 endosymbiont]